MPKNFPGGNCPAARLELARALGRASVETRKLVADALEAGGHAELLARVAAVPAAVVPLHLIDGDKTREPEGSFRISDPAFGDLTLTPENDGKWRAFHMSWHGDSAGHVGAGIFADRLDGLRALLGFAHDAVAHRYHRATRNGLHTPDNPDGGQAAS